MGERNGAKIDEAASDYSAGKANSQLETNASGGVAGLAVLTATASIDAGYLFFERMAEGISGLKGDGYHSVLPLAILSRSVVHKWVSFRCMYGPDTFCKFFL